MQKEKISLVVFDMAGTTVNEDNVVYKTLRDAVNSLGHDFSLDTVLLVGGGKEKFQAVKDILSPVYDDPGQLEADAKVAFQYFLDHLKVAYEKLNVVAYAGAQELFGYLQKRGVKVVLNTGYNRATATSLVQKLNWEEGRDFDLLVTASDVSNSRPAPDMIVLAMERLGIDEAEKVAKVGDSIIDIEEGKAAGCGLNIGITTGAQTKDQLATANPDLIIDSLLEMKDQVKFKDSELQQI
ncbi:phosphonatase-like hydrolase [Flavilitoribacter nigricans]|uniref:HAD family hydrolase n=1 Tax=Flavilitoribacter nigricans (strain ATCC 23147 / DSM 23189 / NBRC 102662 / NCIMB 1420 / SS-2) TaxID=1122177 RepID=A0A2D0N7U3_FLAN2|nr:phosphonatase-like hydrolase [Flavilitoribacter nigricans]PHN04584.1 HAD family hydrolase [Flavilitoribacter nigricans DSM 23189 = NBRC 102662]